VSYAPPTSRDTLLRPVKIMTFMNKFWICDGIRRGTITIQEAMAAHEMSSDEIFDWMSRYKRAGIDGFRRMNRNRRRSSPRRRGDALDASVTAELIPADASPACEAAE
jgi:hypothetical protein